MGFFANFIYFFVDNPSLIAAGFLIYVFIYAVSVFFSGPKPGPNPFKNDTTKPTKPVVLDKTARDKVLKQGFTVKRIPENLDAIVIGSGIGGLSAANILAKSGKRVLVLEQHDQAGGCCHSFEEKGFDFDPGIHYIGQMKSRTSMDRVLMDQLTEGQVTWADLDDEYDVVALGTPGKQKLYPMKTGRKEYIANLKKLFPDEHAGIDKFLSYINDIRKNQMYGMMLKFIPKRYARLLISTGIIHLITKYFKLANRSVQDVMDECTSNKDLQTVLSYACGDYGTAPSEASFSMQAGLTNHFYEGASYPNGGSSEFAFHMIPVIERAGGKVLVRVKVDKILTNEKGHAIGVSVKDTNIFAPKIISDAGVVNTFGKLLPREIASKTDIFKLMRSKRVKSGVGCMSVFIGLRGTSEELQLKRQNVWAYTHNNVDEVMTTFSKKTIDDVFDDDVPLLFVSFPSAKDPTYNDRHPGTSTCTIITLAKWEWFSRWSDERIMKRGDEYEAIKKQFGQRMWEQALTLYPQLQDKVEYFEVGTPVSNAYYLNSPEGEIYGLDHTVKRFGSPEVTMHLRPETEVPGLLLTGQDILSCGFVGALFGGVLCASSVLHRNVYADLDKLRKRLRKAQ